MNKTELLIRQHMLVQKSDLLRQQLKAQSAVLAGPLALLDRGKLVFKWLSHHPVWPLAALVLTVILKPTRAISWGGRLWSAYKTYRSVKAWALKSRTK